jgi:hypothetical protein
MSAAWRVYRLLCVAGFSVVLLAATAILAVSTANDALESPTASIPAPGGHLQLRVFTAGQGSLPPDYRAGVRFVLYDPARLPGWRSAQVASAAFADGWAVRWTSPSAVTIDAGRLSQFTATGNQTWGVTVSVHVAELPPGERECVRQTFRSAIDGVTCFDGMLHRADP